MRIWSFLPQFVAARPSRLFDTRCSLSYKDQTRVVRTTNDEYHACELSATYKPLKEEIADRSKYPLPQSSTFSGRVRGLGLFAGKSYLVQEMIGGCKATLTTSRYVSECESFGGLTLTSLSKCELSLQKDKKIVTMVNTPSHVDLQSR